MFGWLEVLIIAAALLLLFGGAKLPGIASGIGKAVKNYRHGLRGDDGIRVRRTVSKSDEAEKEGE